ncbi:pyridoxal kinase PdxY [Fodinicurvata sp. EGI_FJ10296]|uniref:pyridoxal kinase PdxY n=1 Tax=Fodinicurvata sp. EGI_FJ10296 TaxID=3231908 RepID=UPI0034571B68
MKDGKPTILSIQSSVAYGHVGNSAAVFPLQRLGVEVWPVLTVHFSNHTGYETVRGPVLPAADIADVVRGITERGVLGRCDAVLSGYMGSPALGGTILETVETVRKSASGALYCCDPVMGDTDRNFFVKPDLADFIRDRAVPSASIITPNQFELEFLTGTPIADLHDALKAARRMIERGPRVVLLTSFLRATGSKDDVIELMAVTAEGAWISATPRLPIAVNGCGDMTAALFLAHFLIHGDPAEALWRTVSSVFAVLELTCHTGSREIELIAAQDAIAHPPERFFAEKVA